MQEGVLVCDVGLCCCEMSVKRGFLLVVLGKRRGGERERGKESSGR